MHWPYGAPDKAAAFVRNSGKAELLESELSVDDCILQRRQRSLVRLGSEVGL